MKRYKGTGASRFVLASRRWQSWAPKVRERCGWAAGSATGKQRNLRGTVTAAGARVRDSARYCATLRDIARHCAILGDIRRYSAIIHDTPKISARLGVQRVSGVATLPLRCPMAPPPPSLQSSYVRPPHRRRFASRAPPRKPQSPAWGSKQHVGEAASHTPVRAISSASTKCSREAAGGRRGFVSFSAVVLCKTALKGYSPGLQIR